MLAFKIPLLLHKKLLQPSILLNNDGSRENLIHSIIILLEVGSVYEVKVIKILDFGAVVEYNEAP